MGQTAHCLIHAQDSVFNTGKRMRVVTSKKKKHVRCGLRRAPDPPINRCPRCATGSPNVAAREAMPARKATSWMPDVSNPSRSRPRQENAMFRKTSGCASRDPVTRATARRISLTEFTSCRQEMRSAKLVRYRLADGSSPWLIRKPSNVWRSEPNPGIILPWISRTASSSSTGAFGTVGPVSITELGFIGVRLINDGFKC